MGLSISTLSRKLFDNSKEYCILILGLDAAGETIVLYKLKVRLSKKKLSFPPSALTFSLHNLGSHNLNLETFLSQVLNSETPDPEEVFDSNGTSTGDS
jgi:hypothetical protein